MLRVLVKGLEDPSVDTQFEEVVLEGHTRDAWPVEDLSDSFLDRTSAQFDFAFAAPSASTFSRIPGLPPRGFLGAQQIVSLW